jgi:hypothetical protein
MMVASCRRCDDDVAEFSCRICGRTGTSSVICLGKVPLANEFVQPTEAPSPRYPLHVMHCDHCSLAQLARGVAPERLFTEYAYFSSASRPLVEHGAELRAFVCRELRPQPGDLVIDIGSNDGYLLRDYAVNGFRVLGIEPAHNVALQARSAGIPVIEAYFSAELAMRIRSDQGRAQVLHANNVMAHMPNPLDALVGARLLLDGGDGHLVIETPYVRDLVARGLFDTVYHEHIYYYSFTALHRLLSTAGLVPLHVEPTDSHGGSLRVVAGTGRHAIRSSVSEFLEAERAAGLDTAAYYRKFGDRVDLFLSEVRDHLGSIVASGHRLAGYGAPAKAAITASATGAPLCFVCDSTPYKQGKVLPGTRIPISPPERLIAELPEYCLILAWNYADAIVAANTDYLRRGGTFLTMVDFTLGSVARSALNTVPQSEVS